MAEWARTDLGTPTDPTGYWARVNHLYNGGGLNGPFSLNPGSGSVVKQPGVRTLITGAGLDFLIADPGDILVNPLRPGEVDLFV